ncbi:glycosyltransferase family A protein [Aequorivita sp. CIP111184]|uniref:glycosyltransferase family 2 protein n=1 Tax=Aequorivita sp. CIP111184 TaxID=2211356 RepID=UPI000DBBE46C|nr:glycosyltransferase family A protein [Aequorivita sp. CIP111184]SRX54770.1 UDP-Glc:alpha-D-GlcNAc-diphosphoundecaprenol beta-1,3-glucosyltransferase WfgD [Aequorivita sp. CIP111184]
MRRFSVVIPVFNKEKYIAETIKSVLNQTFSNFEVVILNDGSTDNSEAEILKFKDPRIRYFSRENSGASAARNFAIQQAETEYIALMDADDYWYPFYLEEQNRLLNDFPEESVFATATEIKRNGKIFSNNYSIKTFGKDSVLVDYFEASQLDSVLLSISTVLKKDVFENVGWYDPKIKSGEDTDLYVRIGIKYKVVFSPKVCATYMVRKNSLFQSVKKLEEKANFEAYEVHEKDNLALKKFLDLNRYSLCVLAKIEGNKEAFQKNFKKIDQENLSKKQQFLLRQNKTILKYLSKTKDNLEKLGLRLGTFK